MKKDYDYKEKLNRDKRRKDRSLKLVFSTVATSSLAAGMLFSNGLEAHAQETEVVPEAEETNQSEEVLTEIPETPEESSVEVVEESEELTYVRENLRAAAGEIE